MKKTIRMTERELHRLISESVKRVLNEQTDYANVWGDENFDDMNQVNGVDSSNRRFIEDPVKFAQDLGQHVAVKYNRINARPANGTEQLTTWKQNPEIFGYEDDNVETRNTFSDGMVANNVNTPWQQYGIDQKTFDKKYEKDPENPSQYRPKGAPMYASRVQDNVAFPNPWGQGNMNVDKGGYMMQDMSNKNDTYGIQDSDFDSTYRMISESVKRVLSEYIDMGQVMSSQEREELRNQRFDKDNNTEDIRKKIHSLRREMCNASPEEAENIRQEIINLKRMAGF